MLNLFEIIYEYQVLLGGRKGVDKTVLGRDRGRLADLEMLLKGEGIGIDLRRNMPRLPSPRPAEFQVGDEMFVGRVSNVSGGGMAIATQTPADLGERVTVLVTEPALKMRYVFNATVVWRRDEGRRKLMGLSFVGLPARERIGSGEAESAKVA